MILEDSKVKVLLVDEDGDVYCTWLDAAHTREVDRLVKSACTTRIPTQRTIQELDEFLRIQRRKARKGMREYARVIPTHVEPYERTYQEFWKELVENEYGQLDIEQMKKELADYRLLLQEVPKVYEALTGLSKPNTRAEAVLGIVHDRMIDREMAFEDLCMHAEDGEVTLSVEQLRDYFGVK